MLIVTEGNVGQFKQAAALDVNLLRAVDQDVGDGWIGEQRLERPQAKHLVENFVANLLFLNGAKQCRLSVDERNERLPDFSANSLVVDGRQRFEVDLVQQLPVKRELKFLI